MTRKTDILLGQKARNKIHTGVNKLADMVTATLGARGRNIAIAIQDFQGNIYKRDIIHDGVRVAKEINLGDEFENMGASVLRESAEKTVMAVGDGTTVTILLGQAIFNGAYGLISNGANPVQIKEEIDHNIKELVSRLQEYSYPVKTLEQAIQIATISSQEESIGKMIANALFKLGKDAVLTVEESKSSETKVEYQMGMQLDKGFYSPYFATDPETMTATIDNPYILITDKAISELVSVGKLLNEIHDRQASLVILSPSISVEALQLIIQNKLSGRLNVLCVQAPSFGEGQKAFLQDIAYSTAGKFISSDANDKFEDVTLKDLGKAEYVKADKNTSVIIGGKGKKADVEVRIKSIKKALENEEGEFEKEKLKERLGRLTNGVGVIYVGGFTEIEMKDRKERVIDAVSATKAAMQKGVVPGGEVIFLRLADTLSGSPAKEVLSNALRQPFNKLVSNAGFDPGQMRERLEKSDIINKGIDVRDGKIKDMMKAGIIDPLSVLEQALQNSASVANQLMLTEGIIVPKEVKI